MTEVSRILLGKPRNFLVAGCESKFTHPSGRDQEAIPWIPRSIERGHFCGFDGNRLGDAQSVRAESSAGLVKPSLKRNSAQIGPAFKIFLVSSYAEFPDRNVGNIEATQSDRLRNGTMTS